MRTAAVFVLLFAFAAGQGQKVITCPGPLPNSVAPCRVAFRLDDVQDYYVVPAQMAVMDVFKENKTALTIGVISSPTKFGKDSRILNYVRGVVSDPNWEVEIASHGSNHTDFSLYTLNETVRQVADSVESLKKLLNIREVKTFIPPFNKFNNNTVPALKALNFTHWSAQAQSELQTPRRQLIGQSFYGFPIYGSTNALESDSVFIGQEWQRTALFIEGQLEVYGWAAVMMHPQEFTNGFGLTSDTSVNKTQIAELEKLLAFVRSRGWEILPIGKLNFDAPNGTLTRSMTGFPTDIEAASLGSSSNLNTAYIVVGAVTAGLFIFICIVFLVAFVRQTLSYL